MEDRAYYGCDLMHATTMGTPSGANPHKARSGLSAPRPSKPVSNDTRLPTVWGKNREMKFVISNS